MSSVNKEKIFISNLTGLGMRSYGVSVKYYEGTEFNPHKRIDYNAAITLAEHESGFLMRLNKQEVFFNQHEPDTISERFAAVISRSLYPVETVIDGWGKQVAGIVNHQEILNRWENNKRQLLEKYEGPVVSDFTAAADRKIATSSLLQRSMDYDLFWNLFFHPKYMAYSEKYMQPADLYLSVIPYRSPVRFPGMQRIIPQVTEYGSIEVKFVSEEQEAPEELLPEAKKETPCFMKATVSFDLDVKHHFAMHTNAVLEIYQQEGKYTAIPVKKLQFVMYQMM
ncbi:hypothetical protein [Niabella beijingensis]|uniref:hypothetical protein n=1 Tax=Niabella beijingensis TaxID=2872700 RepID=UPI001CBAD5A0|nr:hypothetical protein [Niabella beijingensis]MBZ4188639.1 hypothetical protein [Niabella beijingensis]